MTGEQKTIALLQSIVAALLSVLSLVGTVLGIPPEYTTPYFAGLVATFLSAGVSLFYAVKRIRAGGSADG